MWILYTVKVQAYSLKLILNQIFDIDYSYNQVFKENGIVHMCGIGSDSPITSVIGFIWYYAILIKEDSSQFIFL